MFWTTDFLVRKGPLNQMWLAGTMKRLNKRNIVTADIVGLSNYVLNPEEAFALPVSGILLLGLAVICDKKARYLLGEASEVLSMVKDGIHVGPKQPNLAAITLSTAQKRPSIVLESHPSQPAPGISEEETALFVEMGVSQQLPMEVRHPPRASDEQITLQPTVLPSLQPLGELGEFTELDDDQLHMDLSEVGFFPDEFPPPIAVGGPVGVGAVTPSKATPAKKDRFPPSPAFLPSPGDRVGEEVMMEMMMDTDVMPEPTRTTTTTTTTTTIPAEEMEEGVAVVGEAAAAGRKRARARRPKILHDASTELKADSIKASLQYTDNIVVERPVRSGLVNNYDSVLSVASSSTLAPSLRRMTHSVNVPKLIDAMVAETSRLRMEMQKAAEEEEAAAAAVAAASAAEPSGVDLVRRAAEGDATMSRVDITAPSPGILRGADEAGKGRVSTLLPSSDSFGVDVSAAAAAGGGESLLPPSDISRDTFDIELPVSPAFAPTPLDAVTAADRTVTFDDGRTLQEYLIEVVGRGESSTFDEILERNQRTRFVASQVFYTLLQMQAKGIVSLEQGGGEFGEITVHVK